MGVGQDVIHPALILGEAFRQSLPLACRRRVECPRRKDEADLGSLGPSHDRQFATELRVSSRSPGPALLAAAATFVIRPVLDEVQSHIGKLVQEPSPVVQQQVMGLGIAGAEIHAEVAMTTPGIRNRRANEFLRGGFEAVVGRLDQSHADAQALGRPHNALQSPDRPLRLPGRQNPGIASGESEDHGVEAPQTEVLDIVLDLFYRSHLIEVVEVRGEVHAANRANRHRRTTPRARGPSALIISAGVKQLAQAVEQPKLVVSHDTNRAIRAVHNPEALRADAWLDDQFHASGCVSAGGHLGLAPFGDLPRENARDMPDHRVRLRWQGQANGAHRSGLQGRGTNQGHDQE